MRWRQGRRSDNVVDLRGSGGRRSRFGGRGGLGLGGLAVVLVLSLLLGKNPMEILGLVAQMDGGGVPAGQDAAAPPAGDETAEFVSAILGDTEDAWTTLFQVAGQRYEAPKLYLFSDGVDTACGGASSASGPFYCPGDRGVYIDLSFFREMDARLGGGGDFAYAYVIAHEVGHHVQTLLGVAERLNQARQRGQSLEGDSGLSVRQELQADCYAGVWAHMGEARYQWLEAGDVEEAMQTAAAIGDDRLQKQAGRAVVPDAFSHGTSEQRARWFKTGFENGNPRACDTFSAARL